MALARRIIPVLLYKGGALVKGRQFGQARVIGSIRQAVRIYQAREVDELMVLDIGATPDGTGPDFDLIREMTSECFMPITVGGGIRTLEHFRLALLNGADKVCINSSALESPTLIREAAEKFGAQAVTVSIDVRHGRVWGRCGQAESDLDPVAWAETVEALGAGEIVLNSIACDGMLQGYDIDLIHHVSDAVKIPVVAAGGAHKYEAFVDAFHAGAHAVAAGALFAFTDATPASAAEYLHSQGIPVRRKIAA
jgi:cyclase